RDVAVAPLADFDIQLTIVLLRALLVPREHAERRRRVEAAEIANGEGIGPIAEGARQDHFAAGPPPVTLTERQVHESVRIDPSVGGHVIIGATPIAWGVGPAPLRA